MQVYVPDLFFFKLPVFAMFFCWSGLSVLTMCLRRKGTPFPGGPTVF